MRDTLTPAPRVTELQAVLPPFSLREAVLADIPQILRLARLLGSTNLPVEADDLAALIRQSSRSFRGQIEDWREGVYLFVLDEAASGRVVGTSMLIAKHGTPEAPHFYLEMATDQRYSKTLKKMFHHTYLTLRRCLDGPTEVGGLIVDPAYRRHPAQAGKQLSFIRFLYLAMYPERFERAVVAELLPPLTAEQESLFWECYGKRVTGLSFREADQLSRKDKEFIDALFPPIPIYTCMLPLEVQQQIGKVSAETEGAVRLLEKIGLRFLGQVDPFDAGPYYGADVKDIVLVQQYRRYQLVPDHEGQEGRTRAELLIGWDGPTGFRGTRISARPENSLLYCPPAVLAALELPEGTAVGAVPFL
ncbi:MAG: arginine N-succinyltransferase [Candidatus Binatia bacterium]|nr:arginine N-succinyltransferase [Candidatus Binatia bacterium]